LRRVVAPLKVVAFEEAKERFSVHDKRDRPVMNVADEEIENHDG
jgi:hypothetical protein